MAIRLASNAPLTPKSPRHLAFLALILLLAAGCGKEPNRFDEVQKETRRNAPAVSKEAVDGALFNKLFPKSEGDFDITYTQEKKGFAQADLSKKKEVVATLSISDTMNNPEALEKFKKSDEKFMDCPIAEVGSMGTNILVGGRYQVSIRSKDANFTKFDREDWLKKFDIANLAKVQ